VKHHRNTENKPLDFHDKLYLLAIYRDKALEIIIKKCVQVGVSEWAICDTFSFCDIGLSVFYTVPTQTLRNTFVNNRIGRLKEFVPYYAKRLRELKEGADSSTMKHFGKGTMKFVGSNAISEFSEFPAHVVTIDELDRCNPANIKYARDRNQAAKIKYYREMGNPTIEGFGIDERFKNSDQKHWMIKCEACGEYQELDFFVNIVSQKNESTWELLDLDWRGDASRDIQVYCKKCGKVVSRLGKGEWVAWFPSNAISGYQLSQLFVPTASVKELWALFQEGLGDETKKQVFYNSRLGLAFTSSGAKLSPPLLQACVRDYLMPSTAEKTTAGIDVGGKLHVKVSDYPPEGGRRTVHVGSYRNFEELDEVMAAFGIQVAVIDAMPETRKALEFQARHEGKVFLCRYHEQPQLEPIKIDDKLASIVADRTQTLDGSHAEVLQKKVLYPKNLASLDNGDFVTQMCAPTRIYDEDKQRFKWVEGTVADHYRHADNYDYIASRILKQNAIFLGVLDVS
jgi:hypothetical protein